MKFFWAFFSLILMCSCSPKLRSSIIIDLPELNENELVVVLDISDEQKIISEKVGEIKSTDNGFSSNCSYYESVNNLKILARKAGANLIRITRYKRPDRWSTCHRLWANIYKVKNVKAYETEIEWSENRKLTWEDFKGKSDTENHPNVLAMTNSAIGFEPSTINLFKDGKLFVRSVFINHGSWFVPEGKTDYVLRHEQIHFDITEIYSRMLRKAFADANVTSMNSSRAIPIFERIKNQWEKRQDEYDRETKHGDKKEIQERWEAIVELELAKYDLYKSN